MTTPTPDPRAVLTVPWVLAEPVPAVSLAAEPPTQPKPAAPAADLVWRGFTGDTDPGDARRAFEARYGQSPRRVFHGLGGILLAGPVPSEVLL